MLTRFLHVLALAIAISLPSLSNATEATDDGVALPAEIGYLQEKGAVAKRHNPTRSFSVDLDGDMTSDAVYFDLARETLWVC